MLITSIGGGDKTLAIRHALGSLDSSDVLIIPSACSTEKSYDRKVTACLRFFEQFGLSSINTLHDFQEHPTETKIHHEIGKASLLYVIGGNTPYMLDALERHGSGPVIAGSVRLGSTAMAGTSAGALLPFRTGQTLPVPNPAEIDWNYEFVTGLSLVPTALAVHANQNDPTLQGPRSTTRLEEFLAKFPPNEATGLAIDNGAALSIAGNEVVTIRASKDSRVRLITKGKAGKPTAREFDTGKLSELVL